LFFGCILSLERLSNPNPNPNPKTLICSSVAEAKRIAIFVQFSPELASQNAQKALFTYAVYTNNQYCCGDIFIFKYHHHHHHHLFATFKLKTTALTIK